MQIKDVMTNNVTTVTPNSSVNDAARVMKDLNVGAVPVAQGQKTVGIITDRDIAIRNVANGNDAKTMVSDVMTNQIISGTPDMSQEEAAELMARNQIRRLPIVENGKLVGIVSLGDLSVNSKSDMEAGKALSSISVPSRPER